MNTRPMRIGVCGLGLIGSSVARGLIQQHAVIGFDPDPSTMADARDLGVGAVDSLDGLADCELLLLAAPTHVNTRILAELMAAGPRVPTADLGSVKGSIERVWLTDPAFPFVGTHPMAGSERAGFESGSADLFAGSSWPVVVHEHTDAATLVQTVRVILSLRAVPVPVTAAAHDRAVAIVSHLPHLLSGALGREVAGSSLRDLSLVLAAGSFRDVSRVAGSPTQRTVEFVGANSANAAAAARAAAESLSLVAGMLEAGDIGAVADWLAPANRVRESFDNRRRWHEWDWSGPSAASVKGRLLELADSGAGVVSLTDSDAGFGLRIGAPGGMGGLGGIDRG